MMRTAEECFQSQPAGNKQEWLIWFNEMRADVLRHAAEMADEHECGGEDDIICQGQNCGMLIGAVIRAEADRLAGRGEKDA